jgi:protein involved in polysaccharide export with SLBB domain
MKRLLLVATTALCLSISSFGQGPQMRTFFSVKFGPLAAGDTLMLGVVQERNPFTGAQMNVRVKVVVGADGRINAPMFQNVRADGLTVPELRQELERRYTEYFSDLLWPCCRIPKPEVTLNFLK